MSRSPLPVSQERTRLLFETADQQSGYFTARQAEHAGYSRRLHTHYVGIGAWRRTASGVYRLRDYPWSEDEQFVQLSLWSRDAHDEPQAVVSHDTALRLHDLSDIDSARIHLTIPSTFRKIAPQGVVLHKGKVSPRDRQLRAGYTVTTPARTLVDAAKSPLSPEHLNSAVREAITRGLVRTRTLLQAVEELPPEAASRLIAALTHMPPAEVA
ncbi:type IV toxin-antitoxin system AbiEi family antitoxin domain-containing protein [Deinococcus ruber]|uniref:AbiEi antitoxin N-terminal domain-containing protein n=1 Tax=Deinococcus ruber TaxID=1848197 RepID=A0A918FDR3_9DEIO|nr:type IV toxin-antitoxin system AbiEi family antitoxin domain-containing protein [Deinococcus ruber]GGR30663.1 hypothetical protein GCM10008957_46760 [Deinococcus ruber]